MKIKAFYIRLSKEHLENDQTAINDFMEKVVVKKTATELLQNEINYWSILIFYEEKNNKNSSNNSSKLTVADINDLTEDQLNVYEILRQWRQEKAKQNNIPSFLICHNTELISIAKYRPQSIEDLSKIKGFGSSKISKLGKEIVALLNSI